MDPLICLCIPTYNRPHLLGRLLRYYRSVGFAHPIVVADSSTPSEGEANERCITSLSDTLDIRYQRFAPSENFYRKIARALGTVDSQYAVLCADKDFRTPSGIDRCAHFLETHHDYSVAHGRTVVIEAVQSSSVTATAKARTWHYRQRTIDSDNPQIRLHRHLQDFTSTFYSVHRRDELVRYLQLAAERTVDLRFGELLPSAISLVNGKAQCLDFLYAARQYRSDISSAKQPAHRVSTWLAADDFSERYARVVDCVAQEMVDVTGMDAGDARDVAKESFEAHFGPILEKATPSANTTRDSTVKRQAGRTRRLVEILPDAARVALIDRKIARMIQAPRRAYGELRDERALREKMGDMSIAQLMDERSPYRADFMPIYEHVVRYPDGIEPSLPA